MTHFDLECTNWCLSPSTTVYGSPTMCQVLPGAGDTVVIKAHSPGSRDVPEAFS